MYNSVWGIFFFLRCKSYHYFFFHQITTIIRDKNYSNWYFQTNMPSFLLNLWFLRKFKKKERTKEHLLNKGNVILSLNLICYDLLISYHKTSWLLFWKELSENGVMPVANSASVDCKPLTIGSLEGLNF